MELICTEKYNDIRFTLEEGDSTSKISYLTDKELADLLKDYPHKFKEVKKQKESSELVVEAKVPSVEFSKVKVTKK